MSGRARSIRRLISFRVVAAVLLSVGLVWLLLAVNRPRPVAVRLVIDGRDVSVEELGRGPDVLILSEGKDISVLASRLADRNRVIVAPAALFRRPGRSTLPALLDQLDVEGHATVVAALPALIPLLEHVEAVTDRVIRLAALDVDRDALDPVGVDRLLATASPHVLFVAIPGRAEAGVPPAPTPEPATALLIAGGLAGIGIRAYRKWR